MYEVTQDTLDKAYKPFDVVSDKDGNVGFVREVSVNVCQPSGLENQISYAVTWLFRVTNPHSAWYVNTDLSKHCNLFEEIAKTTCHSMGGSGRWVEKLFKSF